MRQSLVLILFGLGAIGVGVYEYYDLLALETEGGTRKVHALIKLVYEAGGRYAVLGFFGLVGAACLGAAGIKLVRRPRGEAQTA